MAQSGYLDTYRNCLNRSSSKQLYSFSRKQRFQDSKSTSHQSSQMIALPGFIKPIARGPSFTKSLKKMKFQNQEQMRSVPAPNLYSSRELKRPSQGFTLAPRLKTLNRESVEKTPGPAAYSFDLSKLRHATSFSKSKRKFKFPIENQKGLDAPGPYAIQTDRLRSILSNYQNVKQTKIANRVNVEKFRNIEEKLRNLKGKPQTARTNLSTIPSSFGRSVAFKNQRGIAISRELRKSWVDRNISNTPGPAKYACFSEFAKREKPYEQSPPKSSRIASRRSKTMPIQGGGCEQKGGCGQKGRDDNKK